MKTLLMIFGPMIVSIGGVWWFKSLDGMDQARHAPLVLVIFVWIPLICMVLIGLSNRLLWASIRKRETATTDTVIREQTVQKRRLAGMLDVLGALFGNFALCSAILFIPATGLWPT